MIIKIKSYKDKTITFIEAPKIITDEEYNQVDVVDDKIKTYYLYKNDKITIYDNGVKLFSYKVNGKNKTKK